MVEDIAYGLVKGATVSPLDQKHPLLAPSFKHVCVTALREEDV